VRILIAALISAAILSPQEQTHRSQVMDSLRSYRVHLPATYASATTRRYPVIYWLHGYETGAEERDAQLAAWAAKHDAIIVDSGPVETSGNFPLYLPELADRIDHTLRTVADRDHRGVSGFGSGGFLALWLAAKSPDLLASASALSPNRSAAIGPRGFEVDTVLEDLLTDPSVRTRLINSTDLAAAFDFHLKAFADPLPRPKSFSHADPYPNFALWNWSVISNRRQPGVTLLENVSATGFHSIVREWLPGGGPLPTVKLTVTSPALYAPRTTRTVTYLSVATHKSRRVQLRTDAQGRLTFELDGTDTEVGVGSGPVLALDGYELVDSQWASAGSPLKLRLRFWNAGGASALATVLHWSSPSPAIKFAELSSRLPALLPGESALVPVTITVPTALAGSVRLQAAGLSIDIPIYPPALVAANFKILDEANHDGNAAPGEAFSISLPDGRAELITADPCVDTSMRIVEDGARYTQASIRPTCEPGRVVKMLARTATSYAAIQFPIWYKLPQP
jgi:hypothetical protein